MITSVCIDLSKVIYSSVCTKWHKSLLTSWEQASRRMEEMAGALLGNCIVYYGYCIKLIEAFSEKLKIVSQNIIFKREHQNSKSRQITCYSCCIVTAASLFCLELCFNWSINEYMMYPQYYIIWICFFICTSINCPFAPFWNVTFSSPVLAQSCTPAVWHNQEKTR